MNTRTIDETPMPIPALEQVYDTLAEAIDRAGEEKSSLFLVKLALLQAREHGDAQHFRALVDAALRDL